MRHLRAIHTIWAEGSFARAAERLGVVPSALTETVRQMEEIACGQLFDRRSRPPVPTPLGLDYLKETAPLLAELEASLSRLQEQARGRAGSLRIGATPSAITPLVAPAIARFRAARPAVSITLHDDIAEVLATMVAEGDLDLAIAGRARISADLVQTGIADDPFVLACSTRHAFARRGTPVPLEDIDEKTLVHLNTETGISRILAGATDIPDRLKGGVLQAHSTIAQLCLVRANAGVALMPRNAALLFEDPSICLVPLANLDLRRRMFILTPARRYPTLAATEFEAELRRHTAGAH
nr:LysR family transcriptional regulator [Pseudohalocynthiibacter aestuariivivens]